MMNLLIFGGAGLAEERRNGVLRRLLMNPVRRRELIVGKIAGLVLLGAVQAGLFILLGQFLFGVDFGPSLPTTLTTLLLYVWVASSLGVLIGGVTSREDRIITLCVLGSLLMAALGGCWWPLEIVSPAMRTAGHLFPSAWAMDALHQVITFGGGLREASTPLLALAGFGLAANTAALRFFRV
jgi:ABC-type multidrug transport system permease subunit